jgi:hypothetical protein
MLKTLKKFKTTNTVVTDSSQALQLITINYNKFFNFDKQLLLADIKLEISQSVLQIKHKGINEQQHKGINEIWEIRNNKSKLNFLIKTDYESQGYCLLMKTSEGKTILEYLNYT